MTARYLIIKAKGGLGNRMLSAVTGLVYADLTGRIPVIDWRDGVYAPAGVNAYPVLFSSPIDTSPDAFDQRSDVTPAPWAGRLNCHPTQIVDGQHSGARIYRKSCVDISNLDQDSPIAVYWSYVSKLPRLRSHLRRNPRFRGKSYAEILGEYLDRYFVPNARVQSMVGKALEGIERPIIGAHLRYTDMVGPIDAVVRHLAKLRARIPEAAIFLATDSLEAQDIISGKFDNLHITQKFFPEDGGQLHLQHDGIDLLVEAENAMIDMWALAACDYLIYSKNSTFSATSALIGRLEDHRLFNVDRFNPKITAKRFLQNYL